MRNRKVKESREVEGRDHEFSWIVDKVGLGQDTKVGEASQVREMAAGWHLILGSRHITGRRGFPHIRDGSWHLCASAQNGQSIDCA